MKTAEFWIIKIRNEDSYYAEVSHDVSAFRTLKFETYGGAIAFGRMHNINPTDYVLCRALFVMPEILETREIDYSISTLSIAGSNE